MSGLAAENNTEGTKNVLTDKSRALMDRYKLEYPIFQAAPGGPDLAVAVANAGAMGAISLSWDTPEQSFDLVKRLADGTAGNFYANFVLHFDTNMLPYLPVLLGYPG